MHSALKPSTQNLACSRRQIHAVHTCNLSQAKATKKDMIKGITPKIRILCFVLIKSVLLNLLHVILHHISTSMSGTQRHVQRISTSMSGSQYHVHRISTPMSGSIDVRQSEPRTPHQYIDVRQHRCPAVSTTYTASVH